MVMTRIEQNINIKFLIICILLMTVARFFLQIVGYLEVERERLASVGSFKKSP